MELKVWVEGIQRIVCGVTVSTTCQDVVFALAHATGKVGRFTLIERWRNNERLLAPYENPLKLLLKWGEYANDVQFILQRSESKQQQLQQQQPADTAVICKSNNTNVSSNSSSSSNSDNKNSPTAHAVMLKKPLGLSNTNNNKINNNNNNNKNFNNNKNNNTSSNNSSSSIELANHAPQGQLQVVQNKINESKKSFGIHDIKQNENIGIVRGVPQRPLMSIIPLHQQQQRQQLLQQQQQPNYQLNTARTASNSPQPAAPLKPKHEKSLSNPIDMSSNNSQSYSHSQQSNSKTLNDNNNCNSNFIYQQLGAQHSKSINEINLVAVRDAIGRNKNADIGVDKLSASYSPNNNNNLPTPNINNNNTNNNNNNNNISDNNSSNCNNESLADIYNGNTIYNTSQDLYKNAPAISANGALVPPPYRDPPPPRNSPLQLQQPQSMQVERNCNSNSSTGAPTSVANPFLDSGGNVDFDFELKNLHNSTTMETTTTIADDIDESESIFQATQYNDLLQLIKFQREKISAQQVELSKYDAEIVYLETRERDQARELDTISHEITKADQIFRQGGEQLQTLQYVEEENELVKQQEKTLKSEIALLRSKLANCETELLQCKNKIRILIDDIEMEQRAISNKSKANRQNVERDFLMEMERIQGEIDQAIQNTDTSNKTTENLKKEIMQIEHAIAEKKRQVEQLVNEMKEVNLQSLTVTTSDEIKHLLEGSNKPGSSRRIIGSPRQLENAVPTSKNPHGVWV